jgi:hypothetical protein
MVMPAHRGYASLRDRQKSMPSFGNDEPSDLCGADGRHCPAITAARKEA